MAPSDLHPSSATLRPQRLLVRGLNWLGDAVLSTPALQRLREAQPAAHIALLTPEKMAELWRGHPALDQVITFAKAEGVFALSRRLRGEHFDTALILPNSPRSAAEAFLARIPERIGYPRPWRTALLTRRIQPRAGFVPMRKRAEAEIKRLIESPAQSPPVPPLAHHLYHYLHLVEALGAKPEPVAPHIAVSPEEVAALRGQFKFPKRGLGRPFLFGLNPGAEYGPAKRWPREKFIEAARILRSQTDCQWWIFGGPADLELAASIGAGIQAAGPGPAASVLCLAGQTTLRELCAALKCCDVVLTNDTGPMHLAAAVGTPVVALFGSTSSGLTAPGLPGDPRNLLLQSAVPCAPCFLRECPIDLRCLHNITVERVVAAVLETARKSGEKASQF